MEQKGFLCYNSWLKALEPYGDAEKGRIWTTLLEYSNGLAIDGHSSGNERFILPMLLYQIDRDAEKREQFAEKQRENGKKGGRPPKPKETQQNPENPTQTKKAKDKNKDKDKDKNKDNIIPVGTTPAPVQEDFFDPDFATCFQHYEQNCGTAPRYISERITEALQKFTADLICLTIDDAAAANARNWQYISRILERCEQQGIYTADAYLSQKKIYKQKSVATRQNRGKTPQEKMREIAKGANGNDVSADSNAFVFGDELLG